MNSLNTLLKMKTNLWQPDNLSWKINIIFGFLFGHLWFKLVKIRIEHGRFLYLLLNVGVEIIRDFSLRESTLYIVVLCCPSTIYLVYCLWLLVNHPGSFWSEDLWSLPLFLVCDVTLVVGPALFPTSCTYHLGYQNPVVAVRTVSQVKPFYFFGPPSFIANTLTVTWLIFMLT